MLSHGPYSCPFGLYYTHHILLYIYYTYYFIIRNSKLHAPRKAGKSELLCAIASAAEHLQLGKRLCVITTSGRMVRALTCRIAARCRRNGLLAATIDGYDDDDADQHAMLTNNNNDGWMRCIVGRRTMTTESIIIISLQKPIQSW